MRRVVVRVVLAASLAVVSACVDDLQIDDVPWACTRDSQCGWRARCIDNVCVLVDADTDNAGDTVTTADTGVATDVDDADNAEAVAPTPTGFVCEASLQAPDPDQQATFTVFPSEEDGRLMITVTLDGLTETFDLPPDVELVDPTIGPLLECCENPCCPPLP